jgi:excisionase family DNA binding protein
MTKRTVTVDEAAGILGISKEALRKRIKRGSIRAIKDRAGRWQVEVDETGRTSGQDRGQDVSSPLIKQLKSENEFLRQQLHQQSIIIYNLSESIKLLEAPKEEEKAGRSWLQKLFKGNRS